ncbi:MAG: hypothetical protein JSV42_07200 [Chloroflexota bacterium]|nr:MAG: hypothetical protein JSV42_07200 [Chloroflexota bacterium]
MHPIFIRVTQTTLVDQPDRRIAAEEDLQHKLIDKLFRISLVNPLTLAAN